VNGSDRRIRAAGRAPRDNESELTRLQGLGLDVRPTQHPWLQVRSLYFHDPEGNTLELVCYDEQVG
jgi:catechol 2,3-dioxygenase-like lactoylglutathione lyase family enzyme